MRLKIGIILFAIGWLTAVGMSLAEGTNTKTRTPTSVTGAPSLRNAGHSAEPDWWSSPKLFGRPSQETRWKLLDHTGRDRRDPLLLKSQEVPSSMKRNVLLDPNQ